MITGDHAKAAVAIARQLGRAEAPEMITGAELEHTADAALVEVAARVDVSRAPARSTSCASCGRCRHEAPWWR
jgi:magnesium-transporting ATPase (P-type)